MAKRKDSRHNMHILHRSLYSLLSLGLVLTLIIPLASSKPTTAKLSAAPLTARAVIAALRHSGLSIEHLQRQATYNGGPSGPPAAEDEAWGFTIGHVLNGDGRLLLFLTTRTRDLQAAWYRQVDAHILVYRNIILWLDRAVPATVATRCHNALVGLR